MFIKAINKIFTDLTKAFDHKLHKLQPTGLDKDTLCLQRELLLLTVLSQDIYCNHQKCLLCIKKE